MITTVKQFEEFIKCCKRWIKRFELNGWEFEYIHTEIKEAYASVDVDLEGRLIKVKFAKHLEVDHIDIEATAKHEMIHALLGRFAQLSDERYTSQRELYEAEEELVRKLEIIIK